jgi:hypothetical protein
LPRKIENKRVRHSDPAQLEEAQREGLQRCLPQKNAVEISEKGLRATLAGRKLLFSSQTTPGISHFRPPDLNTAPRDLPASHHHEFLNPFAANPSWIAFQQTNS